ncbi:hypothetical protein F2P56_035282 [Juglans regia]|uniref:Uncharacterized protein LOC109007479 n=2 Tax=Juglans regia TaxID=51240 RepID=A0A2I4GFM3_JUGRE|nr:uncharacterized protein LOC109007479 [Juglans regia]XP_018842696.1 uncharacterized protein LOC109007479 [Juglans regia]KAF5442643.1 hypothetical protein F2P56_035282 [Juglans regia]
MAICSAPLIPPPNPSLASSFSSIVSIKLTTDNYPLWKVQISAYLKGQDLYKYVDGFFPCPPKFLSIQTTTPTINSSFTYWKRTDQLVLSILFSSLSDSVVGHFLFVITSSNLWHSLASMFTLYSHAKQFQVQFQLANLSRGDIAITEYFGKVRALADILAISGNPLPDQDFVTYLLTGLGSAYESFITSITTRAEPISSHELFQLLLVHENRIAHAARPYNQVELSAHFTTTGSRDQRGRGFTRGGRHGRNGRGRINNPLRGGCNTHSAFFPIPSLRMQPPGLTVKYAKIMGMLHYNAIIGLTTLTSMKHHLPFLQISQPQTPTLMSAGTQIQGQLTTSLLT